MKPLLGHYLFQDRAFNDEIRTSMSCTVLIYKTRKPIMALRVTYYIIL